MFIKTSDILVPWMGHLFRASFSLNYFPEDWLTSKIIVVQKPSQCQDWFFADLIFQGVRGSGHGLVIRPKGYVAESCFPKGRKADQ